MFNFLKKESISDLRVPHNFEEIKKRIKIVVIDDDEASFPYQLLRSSGYTIEWWDKVDDRGLERLERNQFDIIILDLNDIATPSISSTDGIGILERLKEVNPTQIIVAFSGQEYDIEKTHFFVTADDTLSKPVDFVKAKNLIDRIIEQKITISYFWISINSYLVKEGIDRRKISKVEQEIVKALKGNRTINYKLITDRILNGVDAAVKVISIIQKLTTILGYSPE
jgi:DNA-binding response OmpR family regulator